MKTEVFNTSLAFNLAGKESKLKEMGFIFHDFEGDPICNFWHREDKGFGIFIDPYFCVFLSYFGCNAVEVVINDIDDLEELVNLTKAEEER